MQSEFNLGNRFKEIRQKLNYNQEEFAEKLGTKQSKISKIENNMIKFDILYIVNDACKLAGITFEQFFNNEEIEQLVLSNEERELFKKAQGLDKGVLSKIIELLDGIKKEKL